MHFALGVSTHGADFAERYQNAFRELVADGTLILLNFLVAEEGFRAFSTFQIKFMAH